MNTSKRSREKCSTCGYIPNVSVLNTLCLTKASAIATKQVHCWQDWSPNFCLEAVATGLIPGLPTLLTKYLHCTGPNPAETGLRGLATIVINRRFKSGLSNMRSAAKRASLDVAYPIVTLMSSVWQRFGLEADTDVLEIGDAAVRQLPEDPFGWQISRVAFLPPKGAINVLSEIEESASLDNDPAKHLKLRRAFLRTDLAMGRTDVAQVDADYAADLRIALRGLTNAGDEGLMQANVDAFRAYEDTRSVQELVDMLEEAWEIQLHFFKQTPSVELLVLVPRVTIGRARACAGKDKHDLLVDAERQIAAAVNILTGKHGAQGDELYQIMAARPMALLLASEAEVRLEKGDGIGAWIQFRRALLEARRSGDTVVESRVLHQYAIFLQRSGENDAAAALLDLEAEYLGRKTKQPWWICNAKYWS